MIHLTNSWNFMARCFVLCTCKEPLQMAFLWDQIWGVKLVKNHGLLEAKSWISTWSGQGRTPSSWHSCYISGWASKRGQGGGSLCSLGLVSLRLCVSLKALDWGVMLGGGSWKMERLRKFFFFRDGCWNDLASPGMLFAGIDYSWQKTVRWSDQFSNRPASSLERLRVKCLQLSSAPISMLGFSKRVGVPRITIEFKDQLASSIDSMSFLHIFYRWIQPMSFFLALGLHTKSPWWLMQEENYPMIHWTECFLLCTLQKVPYTNTYILLMEEILHHLGCIKPCK